MSTQSPFRETNSLSLVEETALESGDMVFTRDELEAMDAKLIRRLAAEAESDAINGKSTKLEMISFFSCQRTLTDY